VTPCFYGTTLPYNTNVHFATSNAYTKYYSVVPYPIACVILCYFGNLLCDLVILNTKYYFSNTICDYAILYMTVQYYIRLCNIICECVILYYIMSLCNIICILPFSTNLYNASQDLAKTSSSGLSNISTHVAAWLASTVSVSNCRV